MEGMACNVIRRMIMAELVPADTSADFFSLIAFVAFQHGRTPKAGEVINEMATKLSRAFLKMPGIVPQEHQPDIAKLRAEWPNAALQSLGMAASVSHVLLDLHPYLLVNHSSTDFIASDSPVVFFNPWCRGARGKGVTGFRSTGVTIELPRCRCSCGRSAFAARGFSRRTARRATRSEFRPRPPRQDSRTAPGSDALTSRARGRR
jgi:hypothetical protein